MLQRKWLDTSSGEIGRKNINLDYGIIHCEEDGLPIKGFIQKESTSVKSTLARFSYIEKFGIFQNPQHKKILQTTKGGYLNWNPPSIAQFLDCFILLRRFILGSCEEKTYLLLNKLGFDDIGLCVGDGITFSKQYSYRFETEPSQLELWINENGQITELNRFHNEKFEEIKIPITIEGLQYLFIQVFVDTKRVNFSKLHLDETIHLEIVSLLDLKVIIPKIDKIPLIDLKSILKA